MHPLNIRKHFHVYYGLMGSIARKKSIVLRTRDDANVYARKTAKEVSLKTKMPYKGGNFGSSSLAFYAIGSEYVEVVACNESGLRHRQDPKISGLSKIRRKTR